MSKTYSNMNHHSLSEYDMQVLSRARALSPGPPPPPWKRWVDIGGGGILLGGWTLAEHVVLISAAGYSVTDPLSGQRLVRDRGSDRTKAALARDWLSFALPHSGEAVPVFGARGGDGVHTTRDEWSVRIIYPWWPHKGVVMAPPPGPGASLPAYLENGSMLNLTGVGAGWLKCGFSPSGQHLMVLDSAGAVIISRPAAP